MSVMNFGEISELEILHRRLRVLVNLSSTKRSIVGLLILQSTWPFVHTYLLHETGDEYMGNGGYLHALFFTKPSKPSIEVSWEWAYANGDCYHPPIFSVGIPWS